MVQNSMHSLNAGSYKYTVRTLAGALVDHALNAIYPPRCGGCQKWGEGFWCATCDAAVQRLNGNESERELITENQRAVMVVSASMFGGTVREGIHALKYNATPHMARPLSGIMEHALPRVLMLLGESYLQVLVPVPLHTSRRRERGYNQSELLAKALGRRSTSVRVEANAMRRTRRTLQQAKLNADQRKQNVLGAFVADPRYVANRSIILVDDVMTTGSTIAECADSLFAAGARNVVALTLARADE